MTPHYTFNSSPQAEKLLEEGLSLLADDFATSGFAADIEAVALGGGYGRGEGGATKSGNLYNDLDFFVLPRRRISAGLNEFLGGLSRKWQNFFGIDVDFCAVTRRNLQRNADTLMIRELQAGHRIIYGKADALSFLPQADWRDLPQREGARLMLNRGAGLLLARQKLAESNPLQAAEADFVIRNIRKAALGCGDAILIFERRYRRSGMERLAELQKSESPAITEPYRLALEAKYTPAQPAPEDTANRRFKAAVQLWLDTLRRLADAETPEEAARKLARLDRRWSPRTAALNLIYWPRLKSLALAHPRLRLLPPLAALLAGKPSAVVEEQYLELWRRFN